MKFKNKILLASASLLVLSGAAASTGVFAWYTANRAAEVKVTTMTATSTEGTLTIAKVGDGKGHGVTVTENEKADGATQDLNITPDTNAYLVDVTGDGHSKDSFNRPFYVTGADMVGHWDNEDAYRKNYSTNAFYYYSFDLKFSIGGGDGTYGLLLSKSCTLTDKDATTTVADTVRLSAVNAKESRYVYANINGGDSAYYTYSDPNWTEVKSITGGKADQGVLTKDFFSSKDADSSTFNFNKDGKYDDNYLGNIPHDGDLTVTFYVWVEGHASANKGPTDDLAAAGDSSATFNLNLKFYTLKA